MEHHVCFMARDHFVCNAQELHIDQSWIRGPITLPVFNEHYASIYRSSNLKEWDRFVQIICPHVESNFLLQKQTKKK